MDDFDRVEHLALEALAEFLESDGSDPSMLAKARVAQAALSAIQRRRASDGAREALQFAMARSLTTDPVQLAEYIRVTQPNSPILRAIRVAPALGEGVKVEA